MKKGRDRSVGFANHARVRTLFRALNLSDQRTAQLKFSTHACSTHTRRYQDQHCNANATCDVVTLVTRNGFVSCVSVGGLRVSELRERSVCFSQSLIPDTASGRYYFKHKRDSKRRVYHKDRSFVSKNQATQSGLAACGAISTRMLLSG